MKKKQLLLSLNRIAKKLPLVLLQAAIIAGAYYSLNRHYYSTAESYDGDWVYFLESRILDYKFRVRGKQKPTGQLGVLAIDEKTLAAFGEYPISRAYYEGALKNLKKLGVRHIGFDAIFVEPSATKLREVAGDVKRLLRNPKEADQRLEQWLNRSPADEAFARGIKSFGSVVLGFFYFGSPEETKANLGEDPTKHFGGLDEMLGSVVMADIPQGKELKSYPQLSAGFGLRANLTAFNDAAQGFAFFSNNADEDAVNRWVTLVASVNGQLFPSLGFKLAAEHLNADPVVFFDAYGVQSIELIDRADPAKSRIVPVDPMGAGRLLVNHRGPSQTFRHFSLADAYYDRFSANERKALKGMSLLVGATATGTNDIRPNPFDSAIDGVENHAAVFDNIVRGDYLRRPASIYDVEVRTVLVVGVLFSVLVTFASSLFSGLGLVLFLAGFWLVDYHLCFAKGTWMFIAVPSIEIMGLFMFSLLYKYAVEEREKRHVKAAFQHYLSPDVIEQVLNDPEAMALGGMRRECTVFFSDVRSFTTISESLTPEKLCEFMNDYFNPMTEIILKSGGTLDKYIGDAIMAFWGAPIAMPNHAQRAAWSSIEMQFALDKLQVDLPKKGFPKPEIGIGLNTGPMSVGNMGSSVRFSYTAMSDSVNLGSRLEGLTKDYKIGILISESVAKNLSRQQFAFRDLDDIRVKGKTEPVRVFELMRPDLLNNPAALQDLIAEFEQGREAYRARDWQRCEKHLMNCFKIRPDDGPTSLYMERVMQYKAEEPGAEWDGVYTFKHK